MTKKLLVNGKLINEDKITEADILIDGQRISRIEPNLSGGLADEVIDLQGRYLLPGLIDDQVHFREPGLTHKGSLATESKKRKGKSQPFLIVSDLSRAQSSPIYRAAAAHIGCKHGRATWEYRCP